MSIIFRRITSDFLHVLFIIDPYDVRRYPEEEIPKSCQFPSEVQHVTQLVNMERLRQADLRIACTSSESGNCENLSYFKQNRANFFNKLANF